MRHSEAVAFGAAFLVCSAVTYAVPRVTLPGGTSGKVAEAYAADAAIYAQEFVANPTDCATDRYATAIAANGNLSCGQVSLTAGVSGTLPIANGGTNATASPTAGGVAYGTGSAYAFSSAGSSGDCLKSNGSSAPTWGSCSSISAYSTIQEEGTPLTQRTTLNFIGASMTCVDDVGASATDCTSSTPLIQTARLTGTRHTVASTTATEITGLQVTLAAAGTYEARYQLLTQSSNTGNGYKYGVNFTGSLTTIKCTATHPTTGTTAATGVGDDVAAVLTGSLIETLGTTNSASTTAANLGPNTGAITANANIQVTIECILVTAGSGDLELWQGSEAAVQVSTELNSFVIVTNIP